MKSIIGIIILALCIIAILFGVQMHENQEDSVITHVYTGEAHDGIYSASEEMKSCPRMMMLTMYAVPLNETIDKRSEVRPTFLAYDKHGIELVRFDYSPPRSTYSYETYEGGSLSEAVFHDFIRGTESEKTKLEFKYFPERKAIDVTRWTSRYNTPVSTTSMWSYELDGNGLVSKWTLNEHGGGTILKYERDTNGNVTRESTYHEDNLIWDKWHTYDSGGNEIGDIFCGMFGTGPSGAGTILSVNTYENKVFDACGNWTCRAVTSKMFGSSANKTDHTDTYMEYRSILYYPD